MPPFSPQNPDRVGGGGGVVQLGSCFSFWIKTPNKKKNVKCFPLVPNPQRGGLGVGFSRVPPQNVHFWNKKRLKMRVKNQTQHQRGPRGVGRWNGKCPHHQWDWGSRNENPPSGMGTVAGGHRGSQNEGFVSPPCSRMGRDTQSQNGGSSDVVEFGVTGEQE